MVVPRERRKRTRLRAVTRPQPVKLLGQRVLDRYVIEDELGAGAMGTVYRGRHTKLARDVAIKVMHDHLAHDATLLERFRREATLAGKLAHPNVVSVLDVGELSTGEPVMVMELAVGHNLAAVMSGPLPPEYLVRVLRQLLRGLAHAHALGLVHRDLKPDNVILTTADDGTEIARIVDFGIAVLSKLVGEDTRLSDSGTLVGTPQYMAPEQARGERVDHRADLYALGMMMYEMLSGQCAFDGGPMEIAVQKLDRDPPPIELRAPSVVVDRALDAFMRWMFAREVDQRPASAHVAHEWLELYERDREAAANAIGVR